MGYLGRTTRKYDDIQLGCAGCGSLGEPVTTTVAIASSVKAIMDTGILGRIFGGSRDEKRKKRDQALNELYNMGMDRNIYLHHSDHWGVVRGFADLANEYGQVVIDTLNANIERDPSRGERFIYSANSEQFKMLEQRLTEAIMNDRQSTPTGPSLPTMPGMPGGSQAAGFGAALKHPMVIASAVVGGGAVAYSILKK